MITLTYTQHTVAFPTLPLSRDSETESFSVSLDDSGGGTHGELTWRFVTFQKSTPTVKAVQLTVFGDGLACLLDPRVQMVVHKWREMTEPDLMTPEQLTHLLQAAGAVPSTYMQQPTRPKAESDLQALRVEIEQQQERMRAHGNDKQAMGLSSIFPIIDRYIADEERSK